MRMKNLLALIMAVSLGAFFSGTLAIAQDQSANPAASNPQPAQTSPANPTPSSGAPGPAPVPNPPTATANPMNASGLLVDANAILGSPVRGSDGKDVGKVSRLMLDPKTGRIVTVVIGMGGTLGVGEKLVSVPWESVKVGQDQQKVVVSVDQNFLDQAPKAEKEKGEQGSASPRTAPEQGPPKR